MATSGRDNRENPGHARPTCHRIRARAAHLHGLYNRLRELLLGIGSALERAFDYFKQHGAVVLLTGYQTPAQLRTARRRRQIT